MFNLLYDIKARRKIIEKNAIQLKPPFF